MVIIVILLCVPLLMRKQILPRRKTRVFLCIPPTNTSNLSNFSGEDANAMFNYSDQLYRFKDNFKTDLYKNMIFDNSSNYNTGPTNKFFTSNSPYNQTTEIPKRAYSVQINNVSILGKTNYQHIHTGRHVSPKNVCTNGSNKFNFVKPSGLGSNKYFVLYYFQILFNFMTVGLPITLLIALNIPIIHSMRNSRRMMQQNSTMYRNTQDKNITTVMTIIIIELLLCHIPDRILIIYKNTFPVDYSCPHPVFFMEFVFNLLILINSSTDFIIYYIFRSRCDFNTTVLIYSNTYFSFCRQFYET